MKIINSEIVGRIYPNKLNPRNSEGSFIRLSNGKIALAFSRFVGESDNDHAKCNISVVYSDDNGKSFDTEKIETLVTGEEYGVKNVMSVTLRKMNNGDIGLFFMKKELGMASEYHLRRYKDDFSNLISNTKCFSDDYKAYFVVNNDRVLRTSDGKFIVAAALHPSDTTGETDYIDQHSAVHIFISNDDGITWEESREIIKMDDKDSVSGLQEPGLAELSDGKLYLYSRTDRGCQYESISVNKGENWSKAVKSQFTAPLSPMLITKNPYSGKYYAIWNPIPQNPNEKMNMVTLGRTPFVIAESEDGVNFSEPSVLENEKGRGYCYPAVHFLNEKEMLISYCNGSKNEGMTLNSTVIRRIEIE